MAELKALEHLLAQGKISRRDFLTCLSALGMTAAILPLFFTTPAQAEKPQKGGRLRLGLGGGSTTDSLDPATRTDAMAYNINWQVRNCLTEVDHRGNIVPELAKSWESSPDAEKWTFKLLPGVEFHNGKSLGADDVVFSINHHRGKNSKSAAKSIVDPIDDIKIDDKYTVVFNLRRRKRRLPLHYE